MKDPSRVLQISAVIALLVGTVPVAAAQQGAVGGVVTDQTSGNPIGAARVAAVGTAVFAQTNATGRYVLSGLSAGGRKPGGRTVGLRTPAGSGHRAGGE